MQRRRSNFKIPRDDRDEDVIMKEDYPRLVHRLVGAQRKSRRESSATGGNTAGASISSISTTLSGASHPESTNLPPKSPVKDTKRRPIDITYADGSAQQNAFNELPKPPAIKIHVADNIKKPVAISRPSSPPEAITASRLAAAAKMASPLLSSRNNKRRNSLLIPLFQNAPKPGGAKESAREWAMWDEQRKSKATFRDNLLHTIMLKVHSNRDEMRRRGSITIIEKKRRRSIQKKRKRSVASKRKNRTTFHSLFPIEEVLDLKRFFDLCDTDRTGSISFIELSEVIKQSNAHHIFAAMDINGDGDLNLEELFKQRFHTATQEDIQAMLDFCALQDELYSHKKAAQQKTKLTTDELGELKHLFRLFDRDDDGKVDAEDLLTMIASENELEYAISPEEVNNMIKKHDTDGDNRLVFLEFCSMMQHIYGIDEQVPKD
eukprot:TRINITY_DN2936_c0_g1_i1.p1 TRINITY_DN2936_c0_g1~~TRINITY_DN2936_c0_g1_i1.p1  ORF type:complete len:490 (+),score=156.37 TRINITY_DN2936_c0_g1_i1:170-1471(+)